MCTGLFFDRIYGSFAREYMALLRQNVLALLTEDIPYVRPYVYRALFSENTWLFLERM